MTNKDRSEYTEKMREIENLDAPQSYINWLLFHEDAPRSAIVEAPIHTDTWFTGEYEHGPVKFINTLSSQQRSGVLRLGIVVRFSCHWLPYQYSGFQKGRDGHYHGGDYMDEIAALVSLVLGVRAQAGPITREFRYGGDPLGNPIMMDSMKAVPLLGNNARSSLVPRLQKPAKLDDLRTVTRVPTLSAIEATAVFKAARTYQSALWVADSSPEMAWLFLVSAIETAASHWSTDKSKFKGHDEQLASDVEKILNEHECPKAVYEPLAQLLRKNTKSRQKFLQFLDAFLPEPPPEDERAIHESQQIMYSRPELRKDFNWIYERRSKALHDGVPFPKFVCVPPTKQVNEERVVALGGYTLGATWDFRKHQPLMLHTFEHIVRGALQNWLKSLGTEGR